MNKITTVIIQSINCMDEGSLVNGSNANGPHLPGH